MLGEELIPGRNVDRLDIQAGVQRGTEIGYSSPEDQMVTEYALMRWARGEEDGAEKTWTSYHPHGMTEWRMILAAAVIQ